MPESFNMHLCPINNGIENTEHYFLRCQAYCTIRRDFLSCVNDILYQYGFRNLSNEGLFQISLYGHDKLPYDSNAKILAMTIQYIHDSKRFERMTANNFSEYS